MTIRVTCDQCGSVLKIKDELAGTDGKCPKCKTRFVVPHSTADEPVEEPVVDSTPETPVVSSPTPAKATSKSPLKSPEKLAAKTADKSPRKPAEDDDFDPVSFLMDGPKKKPTLDSEPETPSRNPQSNGSPTRQGGGGGAGGFSLDDDDSAPDPEAEKPAPTRKWGAKKDASAAASADRSLGGSTNAAKDLLAKSMEESRVRASEIPEEPPRFDFDIKGFIREVGVKGVGSVVGVIVAVFGIWWLMNSMLVSKVTLPPLGYVSGTVTSGGQPAVGVMVSFRPIELEFEGSRSREKARDSVGITDSDGQFDLYYLPEVEGVKVGPCRIILESTDPAVVVPPDYGLTSQHKVDVKKGSNPSHKIEF